MCVYTDERQHASLLGVCACVSVIFCVFSSPVVLHVLRFFFVLVKSRNNQRRLILFWLLGPRQHSSSWYFCPPIYLTDPLTCRLPCTLLLFLSITSKKRMSAGLAAGKEYGPASREQAAAALANGEVPAPKQPKLVSDCTV